MKIYESDSWLSPYRDAIDARHSRILEDRRNLLGRHRKLRNIACDWMYYPLHRENGCWVMREWAPGASRIFFVGDCNNWKRLEAYSFTPLGDGNWEIRLPEYCLHHGDLYKLFVEWPGGGGERIPAYCTRMVQDDETKVFCAQVWNPAKPYRWRHGKPVAISTPFIYECHIGMSSEDEKVSSFDEFRTSVLPRVISMGYNVLQIMALQEHPYYGSFGYQVSGFYALSSRFGTPEEFKRLVDEAHAGGIAVIMDIVHSHTVGNEAESIVNLDGSNTLYCYKGPQGYHPAWGTRCFDYGDGKVKCFLLSNCRYWMEEYHIDGFRFDGVTSMIYWNHGLGEAFCGYDRYFGDGVDENALSYLALANMLIHEINPSAITIAEDVSGLAGLAAPFEDGGIGFDYRMAMGIADHWIKWIKEVPDENWSVGEMWYELTNRRADEKTVSYAECHDQALVGDKTIIFRLIDSDMYDNMGKDSCNLRVDRGIALHKMIRLVTAATCGGGYLNFMGNEFGHPEWIDFPRQGNGWSYKYARRQWSLPDNDALRYRSLENFDREMVNYLKSENLMEEPPVLLTADEERKVLVFARRNSIFAFNFHPSASYGDYRVGSVDGTFVMAFNSDEARFGGFARLEDGERHIAVDGGLPLYIPSRCAVVLDRK